MTTAASPTERAERVFAAPLSSLVRRFPTEPSFVWPLLLAFLLAGVPLFLCYRFLPGEYESPVLEVTLRILAGNWISPLIFWFFAAALVYLWLKRRSLTLESRTSSLLAEKLLPQILEREGERTPPGDLAVRLRDELVHTCPVPGDSNLLYGRCHAALTRLARQQASGAGEEALAEDAGADTERRRMQASYLLPRFWVWAIPILGFIGTVWGISRAIEGFAESMKEIAGTGVQDALAKNLPEVTRHLATAFDTTFLALVLSIPLMLLMTWVEKKEENYLSTLDEIWATRVLRLLPARWAVGGQARHPVPGAPDTDGTTGGSAGGSELAGEVAMLSKQVRALGMVMEDIYEVQVASRVRQEDDGGR